MSKDLSKPGLDLGLGERMRTNIRLSEPVDPVVNQRTDQVRFAVIGSIRDLGREDQNGRVIQTYHGERYMPGTIEMLIRLLSDQFDDAIGRRILKENPGLVNLVAQFRERFAAKFEFVGLVTDDHERDDLGGYDLSYRPGGDWIMPADGLRNQAGELVSSLTHHMPSEFRRISGKREPERKAEVKREYEGEILQVFREMGADVILSDHLMFRLDRVLDPENELVGRIVNIHPAITNGPNALRGPVPTQDALDRAAEYGYTGSTFHMINRTIDDGPLVADAEPTHITTATAPMDLRYDNYTKAKIPTLVVGLDRYFDRVLPLTDGVNMPQMKREEFTFTSNPAMER